MEKMEKVIVMISKDSNGYGAWIENLPGVYGEGDTVEDAKQSIISGLNLYIKHNKNLPNLLQKEYDMEYHLDVLSFLDYYSKIFSKPALEKITGINQKQWFHYTAGRSKPTKKTIKKIDDAFRNFANEISCIHFYKSI
jgi:predicted RNase H-like HicB family nuclease